MKKGFTIIEMLVVVAILAVLMTLVATGFGGFFYTARLNKALALKQVVQSGINTYYARTGEWPQTIQNKAKNMDEPEEELSDAETDQVFQEIVNYALKQDKNPIFDVTEMFTAVSGKAGHGCRDIAGNPQRYREEWGVSASYFTDTKHVTGKTLKEAMRSGNSINTLAFGYEGPNHRHFCRFRLSYNAKLDRLVVNLQTAQEVSPPIRDK